MEVLFFLTRNAENSMNGSWKKFEKFMLKEHRNIKIYLKFLRHIMMEESLGNGVK